MANYGRVILLITGIACFVGGVVLMILGKIWGLLLLLLGFGCIVAFAAMMLRTGGYYPDKLGFRTTRGNSRQRTQADQVNYQPDNLGSSVWDQLEEK